MSREDYTLKKFSGDKASFADLDYEIEAVALKLGCRAALTASTESGVERTLREKLAGHILTALGSTIGESYRELAKTGSVAAMYAKLHLEFGTAVSYAEKTQKKADFESLTMGKDEGVVAFATKFQAFSLGNCQLLRQRRSCRRLFRWRICILLSLAAPFFANVVISHNSIWIYNWIIRGLEVSIFFTTF